MAKLGHPYNPTGFTTFKNPHNSALFRSVRGVMQFSGSLWVRPFHFKTCSFPPPARRLSWPIPAVFRVNLLVAVFSLCSCDLTWTFRFPHLPTGNFTKVMGCTVSTSWKKAPLFSAEKRKALSSFHSFIRHPGRPFTYGPPESNPTLCPPLSPPKRRGKERPPQDCLHENVYISVWLKKQDGFSAQMRVIHGRRDSLKPRSGMAA